MGAWWGGATLQQAGLASLLHTRALLNSAAGAPPYPPPTLPCFPACRQLDGVALSCLHGLGTLRADLLPPQLHLVLGHRARLYSIELSPLCAMSKLPSLASLLVASGAAEQLQQAVERTMVVGRSVGRLVGWLVGWSVMGWLRCGWEVGAASSSEHSRAASVQLRQLRMHATDTPEALAQPARGLPVTLQLIAQLQVGIRAGAGRETRV